MPLSPEVLDALQGEYDRLTEEARELAALLRRHNRLPDRGVRIEAVMHRSNDSGSDSAGRDTRGAADASLRDAILSVLRTKGRAYKPGELAAELERQGYLAAESPGPLSARLSTEFSVLSREGHITKDPITGRYKIRGGPDQDEPALGGLDRNVRLAEPTDSAEAMLSHTSPLSIRFPEDTQ